MTQTFIVHLLRTERLPFIQSRATWPLMLSSFGTMAIGAVLCFIPQVSSSAQVWQMHMYVKHDVWDTRSTCCCLKADLYKASVQDCFWELQYQSEHRTSRTWKPKHLFFFSLNPMFYRRACVVEPDPAAEEAAKPVLCIPDWHCSSLWCHRAELQSNVYFCFSPLALKLNYAHRSCGLFLDNHSLIRCINECILFLSFYFQIWKASSVSPTSFVLSQEIQTPVVLETKRNFSTGIVEYDWNSWELRQPIKCDTMCWQYWRMSLSDELVAFLLIVHLSAQKLSGTLRPTACNDLLAQVFECGDFH